ncbi:hypothetical protein H112_07537 [Trichophyton rubrum D6]|uniref:MADS box transcription factor n=5 Tax=Trichophyton TaxID=5550 RepID=A0A178EWG1_TRIRU|nr:uncharacterized protein TERG_00139 [Trichophyton rubrum CBS 118892]EZF11346.1 hypothetical protein H100_07563 [Trichophyton rubrum MR850]EZF38170.1 hypothetical protein H102_07526 [Trichophyton rubrum CBS 100081]EZF48845.1 hypothetical protein H103_07550 [Trichophyton rubrum CBS 288.86]EZF59515.1 hypothetical protein H104_07497 [Trichophyton rubrum CBS 289.86]EZF70026.1 hypothetical protein H105_07554 [Trichophyton soudanense CBS 452.61]EZF80873.1 hypothetical protein H110_07543 [Trichophy
MADVAAVPQENPSPSQDDLVPPSGNGSASLDSRKRPRPAADDDDDDDDKPGRERRKIEIKFIQDKSRRHITFSKRKAGIMKKAYELSVLTGTQVLLLVVSETGLVYTFTTPKLQPLVTQSEGKNLIQRCLNAQEPTGTENGVEAPEVPADSPDEVAQATVAAQQQAAAIPPRPLHPGYNMGGMTNEQQHQIAYYQNLQQQQQQQQQAQAGGQYSGVPAGTRMPQQSTTTTT